MDESSCPQHPKSAYFLILITNYYPYKELNISEPICLDLTVFLEVNTLWYVALQNFFCGFTKWSCPSKYYVDFSRAPFHDST